MKRPTKCKRNTIPEEFPRRNTTKRREVGSCRRFMDVAAAHLVFLSWPLFDCCYHLVAPRGRVGPESAPKSRISGPPPTPEKCKKTVNCMGRSTADGKGKEKTHEHRSEPFTIRPNFKQEAGRSTDSEAFPVRIRPKSGPEARLPVRKHYCVT